MQNAAMIYGYARVSTDGQSVAAQVVALQDAGAEKVWREIASGAKTDRVQLRKAITALDAGDVLLVTRLDRLARSTRDLLNTLAAVAAKQAGFRSGVRCCRGCEIRGVPGMIEDCDFVNLANTGGTLAVSALCYQSKIIRGGIERAS